ncbi:MAG TPA: hypothetical protein VIL39_05405 [Verrucomicrobiae bacterium]
MNKTNKTNTDNTFQQGLEGTGAGEWAKVSYNMQLVVLTTAATATPEVTLGILTGYPAWRIGQTCG